MGRLRATLRWLISRAGRDRIWRALSPSKRAWRFAAMVVWTVSAICLAAATWGFAFSPFTSQQLFGVLAVIALLALMGGAVFLALILVSRVSWQMRLATLIGAPLPLLIIAGTFSMPGGGVAALVFLICTTMLGGGIGAVTRHGGNSKGRIAPAVFAIAGLVGFMSLVWMMFVSAGETNKWLADYELPDRTLALTNPGLPGSAIVETFTYGSGADRHRPEYAQGADWTSKSVDGSPLLDGWDGLAGHARTSYWGFDAEALPVQARVWAPAGNGRHPLILIVHGNHAMEDFSDAGYAYLGEHFASRGYITVSVDENFLNSSAADMIMPIGNGGLDEENDARGWLLLEHLEQWSEWSRQAGHPFEGRVDMTRIGLIGHSRGGEAVAIAAAFNTLKAYPDDATLGFDYGFDIGAVIAIAPVDGQYTPRNVKHPLTDVNYLVIHGSMDGDVLSFMGASQYSRIGFSGDPFNFKASLYVDGANHGQFNTSWGANDRPFPLNMFLNKKAVMPGEDQRDIARVYFTAFLDAALNGTKTYLPIFSDPARARGWLSGNYLIANYEDSRFVPIANYEDDPDPTTGNGGARISTEFLTKWYEEDVKLKWNPLDSQTALLAWDEEVYSETPIYRLAAETVFPLPDGSPAFTFSASQADTSTKPKGWEPREGNDRGANAADKDEPGDTFLDWSILLVDASGRTAWMALSSQSSLPPLVTSNVPKAKVLSSREDKEVVMSRYTFPLADFEVEVEGAGFDAAQIVEIRFEFDRTPNGVIYLDDIGFADISLSD